MAETSIPEPGSRAPDFSLPAFPEGRVRLKDFRGRKNVVLYFYPRDNTPGCTKEACAFRDHLAEFEKHDTVVLGVSTDPLSSHEKFAQKYELPFPLLSDEDHRLADRYGVWVEKTMYGRKRMGVQRSTFLIDKNGRIAAAWPKVRVAGHAEAVLEAVRRLD